MRCRLPLHMSLVSVVDCLSPSRFGSLPTSSHGGQCRPSPVCSSGWTQIEERQPSLQFSTSRTTDATNGCRCLARCSEDSRPIRVLRIALQLPRSVIAKAHRSAGSRRKNLKILCPLECPSGNLGKGEELAHDLLPCCACHYREGNWVNHCGNSVRKSHYAVLCCRKRKASTYRECRGGI